MFPGPTELRLIGYSFESISTPKIQIKYSDTKNKLADVRTKENFTRDEWNHLLCLFSISHFRSTDFVLKWCRKERKKDQVKKESQQSQDQWWVWLQRFPQLCHLLASESPGWRSYESESPLRMQAENYDRPEKIRCLPWHKSRTPPPPPIRWKHALSKQLRIGRW